VLSLVGCLDIDGLGEVDSLALTTVLYSLQESVRSTFTSHISTDARVPGVSDESI
jgi:hypothetical protein